MRRWTQDVQIAATQYWDRESLFTGEIELTITYYFENVDLDLDNIPKPILDALKGLVYYDDSQITDMICRKRDLNRYRPRRNASPMVLEALARPGQFLHITVSDAMNEEVQS